MQVEPLSEALETPCRTQPLLPQLASRIAPARASEVSHLGQKAAIDWVEAAATGAAQRD